MYSSNSNFLQFVNLSVPTCPQRGCCSSERNTTPCQHQCLHDFLIGEKAPSEFESIPTDQIVVDVFQSQGKIIVSNEKDHAVKFFNQVASYERGKSFFITINLIVHKFQRVY